MADDESREEQAAELEALEAIFGDDDYKLLDPADDGCARFQVELRDERDPDMRVRLMFSHTPRYPCEALRVVAHPLSGISAPGRKALQAHLEAVAEGSVDMPAAYSVCEAARDWMAENGNVGGGIEEEDALNQSDEAKFETLDSTQAEKVEVVSSKAVGTPVTVESFNTWREAFMQELEKAKSQAQREREANTKLSGREFFESRTVVVTAESASFWESEASQVETEG